MKKVSIFAGQKGKSEAIGKGEREKKGKKRFGRIEISFYFCSPKAKEKRGEDRE